VEIAEDDSLLTLVWRKDHCHRCWLGDPFGRCQWEDSLHECWWGQFL